MPPCRSSTMCKVERLVRHRTQFRGVGVRMGGPTSVGVGKWISYFRFSTKKNLLGFRAKYSTTDKHMLFNYGTENRDILMKSLKHTKGRSLNSFNSGCTPADDSNRFFCSLFSAEFEERPSGRLLFVNHFYCSDSLDKRQHYVLLLIIINNYNFHLRRWWVSAWVENTNNNVLFFTSHSLTFLQIRVHISWEVEKWIRMIIKLDILVWFRNVNTAQGIVGCDGTWCVGRMSDCCHIAISRTKTSEKRRIKKESCSGRFHKAFWSLYSSVYIRCCTWITTKADKLFRNEWKTRCHISQSAAPPTISIMINLSFQVDFLSLRSRICLIVAKWHKDYQPSKNHESAAAASIYRWCLRWAYFRMPCVRCTRFAGAFNL